MMQAVMERNNAQQPTEQSALSVCPRSAMSVISSACSDTALAVSFFAPYFYGGRFFYYYLNGQRKKASAR
jgi:hypothetical protein